jgi:NADH:ubiquinone oxidoreductase subunit 6 (subunit J)
VTVADALLLALGAVAVGSGALVVTSAHLVRAGLYLVISLGATAGLYLVLGAEMVAWVQVLVYVGAVVVLLLFAVMLTRAPIGPSPDLDRPAGPAALIGGGVGFGLTVLLVDAFRWTRYELPPAGTAERVGEQVFGAWVLPFEVLSILLLSALVGAIILSRPDLAARKDIVASPPELSIDPAAETADVVARLSRIAARQATAEANYREAAAARAGAARAAAEVEDGELVDESPVGRPGPADRSTLKRQAGDVIFRAQEARPRLGEADLLPAPPADDQRVIEGTSKPAVTPRPALPAPEKKTDRPALPAPQTEKTDRPALPGPEKTPELPAPPPKTDGEDA